MAVGGTQIAKTEIGPSFDCPGGATVKTDVCRSATTTMVLCLLATACATSTPPAEPGEEHGGDGGAGLSGGSGGTDPGTGGGTEGGGGTATPDFCAELGDGQWCDGEALVTCGTGQELGRSDCTYGCDSSSEGGAHLCTEPNPDACIGKMDGRWCDLTDLVHCQDDDVLWRIHCSSGCESMAQGTPDRCYPEPFCTTVPNPVSSTAPTEACNYMDWELSPDGFYLISRFGTSADQTTWGHGTTCGYLQGHYDYQGCRYDVHGSGCLDNDYAIPWAQGHVDYDFETVIDTVNTHMVGDVPDPSIFYVADAQRFNCGAVLRVSNPETHRCVVVYTEDGGPGTLYEGPNYGARRTLDASPAVSHYLLVDDWGWAHSDLVYVEWGLP
ncbi:MAG: hypothetical protein JRI68_31825, partial [Deltaproteobacteria bacterium]|nr:hypothetical protein [Deltaproteobacteria bacterium]